MLFLAFFEQAKRLRSPDGADAAYARENKIRALDNDSSTADVSEKSLVFCGRGGPMHTKG